MIDLRKNGPDEGTIAIDFEDGNQPVVITRPKAGQYRRLWAEQWRIVSDSMAHNKELKEQGRSDVEIVTMMNERSHANVVAWWNLILVGDDTFKKMTTADVPPADDWPVQMIYGKGIIETVLAFWRDNPLDRGGESSPAEPATNGQAKTETTIATG